MLTTNTPAPFPEVGSWALTEVDGATCAALIHARRPGGEVMVSVYGRSGASATRTVPLDALQDPTPLTPAERAELDSLAARLRQAKRGNANHIARRNHLQSRSDCAAALQSIVNAAAAARRYAA